MVYTARSPELQSLEQQASRDNGAYGYMVMMQNSLVASGQFDPDFERLTGPQEPKNWVEIKDLEGSYNFRDEEVLTPEDVHQLRHPKPPVHIPCTKVNHLVGREFYFETLDVYRGIILSAKSMKEIYWMIDACEQLDRFMAHKVQKWSIPEGKTTFDRLYKSFIIVEERVRRKTYLMKIDTIRVSRKEKVSIRKNT